MNITASDLKGKLDAGTKVLVLDVRTPAEFEEMRILESRSMPLDRLDPAAVSALLKDADECVVVCHSGKRSAQAVEKLQQAGCDGVSSLQGGLETWAGMRLPVERSAGKRLPIMRQVMLIAGSVVLLGTILSLTVSPWWAVLPGFFGAGLAFAGLTGHCGMAMMLAKMPWNKTGGCDAGSCRS